VPPLRERADDIPMLVEYFVARHGARLRRKFRSVSHRTMNLLMAYSWPGNIRELENVIERAAILSDGETLQLDESMLPGTKRQESATADPLGTAHSANRLDDQEVRLIEEALATARGRVSGPSGAAARLGIPPTTLDSKIRKFGIDKLRFRRRP
jgi:formate hydrogenlyase transcriptional activator